MRGRRSGQHRARVFLAGDRGLHGWARAGSAGSAGSAGRSQTRKGTAVVGSAAGVTDPKGQMWFNVRNTTRRQSFMKVKIVL